MMGYSSSSGNAVRRRILCDLARFTGHALPLQLSECRALGTLTMPPASGDGIKFESISSWAMLLVGISVTVNRLL